jgi:hypothetical protein
MTEDEENDLIDAIYQHTDSLMRMGDFDAVGYGLDGIDVEKWPTVILLAHLSITTPAKHAIGPQRARYAARVRRRLTETEPGQVDALMSGLE